MAALLGVWTACSEPAPETPEVVWQRLAGEGGALNVVLITIDTLRADHLGVYGHPRIETPHLDRLAREGVRFANAASTVAFTLPAHASILTGTYPPAHGIRENVGYYLDQRLPTLAGELRAGGYATAGFVSAFVLDARWGIGRGFDHYFDDFDLREMDANLSSVQRDGAETVAAASAWLANERAEPFFLWVHLYDPHDPYRPPEPYASRYPQRPYDGEVAYADSLVGTLRQALEEEGVLDRTLVVLTADHGEGLGSHGESFHGYFVYDSTVRVPLIVRVPFGDFGGRVVEAAVSHVDLMPTVLAATGRKIPAGVRGKSLLPLILGLDEDVERAVYSESFYPLLHYGWSSLRSLRSGRYKYVEAPAPELYDLVADPGEERNLVRDRRQVSRRLRDRLRALTAELDAEASTAPAADLDETTLEQLRALGYVAGRGQAALAEEDEVGRADPKERIGLHRRIMAAQSAIAHDREEVGERLLKEVLANDPTMVDPHQMLGLIANRRQDHEQAVGHFRHALELRTDHQASLFGLAHAYRGLGRDEEALVGFRRLVELNPRDSKAALAMARIHVGRDELTAALEILEAAARFPDAPAPVRNQLGELLVELGRPEEARAELRRAIAADDRLAQPHFNLGVLCEQRGDVDQAMAHYEAAIVRAPRHFQAQFNLGRLAGERGDYARQQELYEAAIEANPDFTRGYYFLAKLLMDRDGDLRRAEELTRQGLATDPDQRAGPLGYFVLADLLNRTGRPAQARQAVAEGRRIQARSGG